MVGQIADFIGLSYAHPSKLGKDGLTTIYGSCPTKQRNLE